MAWKDNALGFVIDREMDTDFAGLKAQGIRFVVIDVGTGWDMNPAFGEQFDKAKKAGLPVLAQYTPIPAVDDYVFEAPAREQISLLKKALGTRAISGLIISIERWWVGWDQEQNHVPVRKATPSSINHIAVEFMRTFYDQYSPLDKPVLLRTSDGFVQNYATGISAWSDQFGFYLADWRYRTRNADGEYKVYSNTPTQTFASAADFLFPPDGSKNPLVPGSTPTLRFWEFTGAVSMPTALVKGWDGKVKKVKAVIFNGVPAAMDDYLSLSSDPIKEEEGEEGDTNIPEGDLDRIIDLVSGIADDVSYISGVFRRIIK